MINGRKYMGPNWGELLSDELFLFFLPFFSARERETKTI